MYICCKKTLQSRSWKNGPALQRNMSKRTCARRCCRRCGEPGEPSVHSSELPALATQTEHVHDAILLQNFQSRLQIARVRLEGVALHHRAEVFFCARPSIQRASYPWEALTSSWLCRSARRRRQSSCQCTCSLDGSQLAVHNSRHDFLLRPLSVGSVSRSIATIFVTGTLNFITTVTISRASCAASVRRPLPSAGYPCARRSIAHNITLWAHR